MRYSLLVLAAVVAATLAVSAPAQAAWTGDVGGTAVHLNGDGTNDLVEIDTSGAFLSHSGLGAGYSSGIDWNSSPAITQTVPLVAQLKVVIEGNGGDDLVRVGGIVSADAVPFPFIFKGGDGTDGLIVDAGQDTTDRVVDVFADSLTAGLTFDKSEASFNVESVENTPVFLGTGNDTIHVTGTNPSLPIHLDAGDGNDTAQVGTKASGLGAVHGEFAFNGSAGDDTLQVTDAASTAGSVTDIDDGGLRHAGGTVRPASGVDHVSFIAGSGSDSIAKSSGWAWTIDSGPGDDTVATRDAVADSVACGDGADFAVTDPLDALAANCERSDRTAALPAGGTPSDPGTGTGTGGGAGTGTATDTAAPVISIASLRKSVKLKSFLRGLKPVLSANEPATFQAQLLGSARRVTLARAYDVTLAHGDLPLGAGARPLTLKPNKRLVGHARRLTVRVLVTATDAAGNRSSLAKTLKVKR
jgi:hypothetical protein